MNTTPSNHGNVVDSTEPQPLPRVAPSVTGQIHAWLISRRNAGATPAHIASELVAAGWDADSAARAALSSLRSSDRRSILYAALTTAAGVAALAAATGAHLLLDGNPDPELTAASLTVALVVAPIAVWCAVLAQRAENTSRFAVWSPDRRFWFGALAGCTAAVGLLRALTYVYRVIAGLTGAAVAPSSADLAQVAVSLGISVPLFVWSAAQWRRSNVALAALIDPDTRHTSDAAH